MLQRRINAWRKRMEDRTHCFDTDDKNQSHNQASHYAAKTTNYCTDQFRSIVFCRDNELRVLAQQFLFGRKFKASRFLAVSSIDSVTYVP